LVGVFLSVSCSAMSFAGEAAGAITPKERVAIESGLKAAGNKDWLGAIKYFSQAKNFKKTPPVALFNLGLANEKAGNRDMIAVFWYKAYLMQAPDADNADHVKKHLAELQAKVALDIEKMIGRAETLVVTYRDAINDADTMRLANTLRDFGSEKTAREVEENTWQINVSEALTDLTVAKVYLGDVDGAVKTANILKGKLRLQGYVQVAAVLTRLDDSQGANRLLAAVDVALAGGLLDGPLEQCKKDYPGNDAMFEYTKERVDNEKSDVYLKLAAAQGEAGDLSGARNSFLRSRELNPEGKTDSSPYIRAQAWSGDIEGALASLGDDGFFYKKEIALIQAKRGDIDGAKKIVGQGDWTFDNAMKRIEGNPPMQNMTGWMNVAETVPTTLGFSNTGDFLRSLSGKDPEFAIGYLSRAAAEMACLLVQSQRETMDNWGSYRP